jgi:homogentisate 1,2-dioxygenase
MESFVHLRKGRTPKRLHADLDGLKDDELGRGGFTGRTANIYRHNDADAAGGPLLMFSNADCQLLLSRRSEPMPFFVRYVDGGLLSFVHKGTGLLENEFGPLRYRQGDWVYIPKACTFRHIPTPSHTHRLFEAIGHPDKEMHEIPGANHYYSGPDQRDTLRRAVGICTNWLHRHGFSL